MHVRMWTLYMHGTLGGQKISDPLELEFQTLVSQHGGVGNRIQVRYKKNQCSWLMRYLFSPQQLFLIQINAFLVVLGIRHSALYMLDKSSHYCISSSKARWWRVRRKLSPDQSRVEHTVHTHTTSEGNHAQRVTLSHSKYSMILSPSSSGNFGR